MTIEEIKQEITKLAQKHANIEENNLDEFKDAEFLEWKAEHLIIDYCKEKEYLINGFPTEIARRYENDEVDEEEYDDEYFCQERYHLYLDILTYQKQDVAELLWYFTKSFWPDAFDSKKDYIESAKERAEADGFYSVRI